MALRCPYCRHRIGLKDPRPGSYRPRCPKCGRSFKLLVPAAGRPQSEALDEPTEIDTSRAAGTVRMPPRDPAPAGPRIEPQGQQDADDGTIPTAIGGYRIVRRLGRGGMGAVYLARQVSLNRSVALKVMNPAWATNPAFVARFTREAYAAAQLSHPNIVQIYEFGRHDGVYFFSMEYVAGQSLGELVKSRGPLSAESAVGYVLQAARGLKFAHDRGMVHRDVKPDNLLLDPHGIVKIADLGLVKTPAAPKTPAAAPAPMTVPAAPGSTSAEKSLPDVTQAGMAMGTPAFMSPEQARNPGQVDQRADIYSLGCTLHALLTGQAPFPGGADLEAINAPAADSPLLPGSAGRVPEDLEAIIQKMIALKPSDRHADMGQVIHALEEWAGRKGGDGLHALSEDQVARLEDAVREYNDAVAARARTPARLAILGGCTGVALLLMFTGWLKLSVAALLLGLESVAAGFLFGGAFRPSVLFRKLRAFLLDCHWTTWIKIGLWALLFVAALLLLNLFWIWLIVTVVAVAVGAGLHFALDRSVEAQRQPALADAEALFRQLRLRGMDEEQLRHFVCKYAGKEWEEFYEDLFGYEEKLRARDWWAGVQKGAARPRHAAWRDPIIEALDRRLQAGRDAHERATLRAVEEDRLIAAGAPTITARQQAGAAAEHLVQAASAIRAEEHSAAPALPGDNALRRPRAIAALMLEDAPPEDDAPLDRSGQSLQSLFNSALGPTLRLGAGILLLAGWLWWMWQNGLIAQAGELRDLADAGRLLQAEQASPLRLAGVPEFLTRPFDGHGAALAGLFLLVSAFLPDWKSAVLMVLGAVVAWLGPRLGIPDVGPLGGSQAAMIVGGGLALAGILLGRRR